MAEIRVTKADGTLEVFRPEKLKRSLKNAGASSGEIHNILTEIENNLFPAITTQEIYTKAFALLRNSEHPIAARYSLRRALFGLGPTGFPFEDYVAGLMRADGYVTKTRVLLQGACVIHELDVIAEKNGECLITEAKFHAQPGTKSDIQVVLYCHARFLDLKNAPVSDEAPCETKKGLVVTNTKFTQAAIEYAECVGLGLISWGYGGERSLEKWIERTKLYPVTVLSSLSEREKMSLMTAGSVLCRDIIDNEAVLSSVGVPKTKIKGILDESAKLCLPS